MAAAYLSIQSDNRIDCVFMLLEMHKGIAALAVQFDLHNNPKALEELSELLVVGARSQVADIDCTARLQSKSRAGPDSDPTPLQGCGNRNGKGTAALEKNGPVSALPNWSEKTNEQMKGYIMLSR